MRRVCTIHSFSRGCRVAHCVAGRMVALLRRQQRQAQPARLHGAERRGAACLLIGQYLTPSLKSLPDSCTGTGRILYGAPDTWPWCAQCCTGTSTSTVSLADTYGEQLRADPTPSSKTLKLQHPTSTSGCLDLATTRDLVADRSAASGTTSSWT